FEQIPEPFVAARVVLPCHLQEQALQCVQTAQGMPRNRVCQPRPHHDKFVLPLALRRACCASDGVVEPPELALRSGIHVPHAAHYWVRWMVEKRRICNQLLDIHRGGAAAAPVPRPAPAGTATRAASARVAATIRSPVTAASWAAAAAILAVFTRRTVLAAT